MYLKFVLRVELLDASIRMIIFDEGPWVRCSLASFVLVDHPSTIFALQEVSFTPPRRIQINRSMNEVREKKRSWSRIEHRLGAKVRFTFSAISSKRIDRSLKSILFTQMIRQIILEKAADVIFIAELGT